MPITIEDAPDTLPVGAQKIYVSAFNSAFENTCEGEDECSAKVAWSAVKSRYKKAGDKWVAKAEEFSFVVTRAALDKPTQEMRWKAVASDTFEDTYKGEMSQELYEDFFRRIESGESPPEEYTSEFWSGGIPYLSLSHYDDFDGKGVPGPVEKIYVDGEVLKSKGKFNDTPIGRACFKALMKDLYAETEQSEQDKIRISIAFLDWKHRHKKTDFIFERKSIDELCPECLLELFTGEGEGIEYLRGHLIHLALTRIPVNKRTLMEVDRSMATKQEDAASIVGEELADELSELEKLAKAKVGKSEALVVMAEEEEKEKDDEEEEDDDEKEKDKKEMKSESVPPAWMADFKADFAAIKALVPEKSEPHPLDGVVAQLKADFDEAMETDLTSDERLQLVQEAYSAIGVKVKELADTAEVDAPEATEASDGDLANALLAINNQLALLSQKLDKQGAQPAQVPARRSIQPTLQMQSLVAKPEETPGVKKSETPALRALIEKTT